MTEPIHPIGRRDGLSVTPVQRRRPQQDDEQRRQEEREERRKRAVRTAPRDPDEPVHLIDVEA